MNHREKYWQKKAAGICVSLGCKKPACEDHLRCPEHREKHREYSATTRSKVAYQRHMTALVNRWRRKRIADGLCVHCGKMAVTKTLCEEHRRLKLERYYANSKSPRSAKRCSLCGEPGHRVETCQVRGGDVPSIEEYATARNSVEAG